MVLLVVFANGVVLVLTVVLLVVLIMVLLMGLLVYLPVRLILFDNGCASAFAIGLDIELLLYVASVFANGLANVTC